MIILNWQKTMKGKQNSYIQQLLYLANGAFEQDQDDPA